MTFALIRTLPWLIAASVLCACGLTPGGDGAPVSARAGLASSQSTAPKSQDSDSQPDRPAQLSPVQKVALSYAALSDPASKTYKVGPIDVLDVTVFKTPELSKSVQVSEAGTINFPLIGELQVAGKTAREIEKDLSQRLGAKYLQNPQITVFVKEHNSQRVTIEGAVKKPGVYPIAGGLSLLQAMAQAGGFEDTADHTVALFRETNGKRLAGRYDVAKIRDGQGEDIQLEAGDVIVVSTSDLKEGFGVIVKLLPLATLAAYL